VRDVARPPDHDVYRWRLNFPQFVALLPSGGNALCTSAVGRGASPSREDCLADESLVKASRRPFFLHIRCCLGS
jgi:hypothetical protein